MAGEPIHLQFTQDDRDMIRDTNRDVKQILVNFADHGKDFDALQARVEKLEMWQTRVMAICCFVGFVSGLIAKVFLK